MKRDSRLSGSMAGLVALVLLVAAASPAVQAQQRNIPIPASSASPGGVAAASAATIEDVVRQSQSLIQNQGAYGRAWTSYFVGQTKCATYRRQISNITGCGTIMNDGKVRFNFWWQGSPYVAEAATPIELAPAGAIYPFAWEEHTAIASPLGFSAMTGSPPSDWEVKFTYKNTAPDNGSGW